MSQTLRQIGIVAFFIIVSSCKPTEDREPIADPLPGADTIFIVPYHLANRDIVIRYSDLNGDGWRDVIIVASLDPLVKSTTPPDSLLVFFFEPRTHMHALTATYADFGLTDVNIIRSDFFSTPLLVVEINGGGNDLVTLGKIIFAFSNDTLVKLAEAPWGDPQLRTIDSMLVLEVRQLFSGSQPHAKAIEYSDSLIPVAPTTHPLDRDSYLTLLGKRVEQLDKELDSLWRNAPMLSGNDSHIVSSTIMSKANLLYRRNGIPAGRRVIAAELQRWKRFISRSYITVLEEFRDEIGNEFAFIR